MCIIVAKPAGASIDLDTLLECWSQNSDGAGVAYAIDGKVIVEKGFMEWEDLEDFLLQPNIASLEQWDDISMLLHFRIATVGKKDEENTHPFEVIPGKLAFAHNGTMHKMRMDDRADLSDTNIFCRYILKQLPHNFLNNTAIVSLLSEAINHNKLAFLDNTGKITIFNEKAGYKEDGVWYSNSGYKPPKIHTYKYYGASGSAYSTGSWWDRMHGTGSYWDRIHGDSQQKSAQSSSTTPKKSPDTLPVEEDDWPMPDWYCYDCASWFSEDESPDAFDWSAFDNMSAPSCPLCNQNTSVVFDPLEDDEDSGIIHTLKDEAEFLAASDATE